jgi:enoyl-CoA hydratase/carnithine racemase
MDGSIAISLPTPKIIAEVRDGIGWLTINQPEKRNAISLEMWEAIGLAVDRFAADPAVRVVVMRGAGGKSFAAGADISEFEKQRSNAEAQEVYGRRSSSARKALAALPKPVIAMIQGFCIGGGLAVALHADIRIASSDSRFGVPAAKLGIAYGMEGLERLVALVGPAKAKEILFLARRHSAEEALAMGLINAVVPAEQLEAEVTTWAREMAANAPLSIRASKETIDQLAGDPARRDPARIEELGRICFDSADYVEGRRAFMEKRTAQFTGR